MSRSPLFTDAEVAELTAMADVLLLQVGTVYARNVTTHRYTDVVKSDLACKAVVVRGGQSQGARAELAALRNLYWDLAYEMPSGAQIDIDGVRWQIVTDTVSVLRGPNDVALYRRCDLVRVGS